MNNPLFSDHNDDDLLIEIHEDKDRYPKISDLGLGLQRANITRIESGLVYRLNVIVVEADELEKKLSGL